MAKERNNELASGSAETSHNNMQRKKIKRKNTQNIIFKNHVIIEIKEKDCEIEEIFEI